MKYALDKAQRNMRDHVRLSFFFNARGGDLEKSVAGAYRTLLVQLLDKVPALRRVFRELELPARQIHAGYGWDLELLKTLLREAISRLQDSAIVCFIDALDESNEGEVRSMLSFLEGLCQEGLSASKRIRICLASRHYPHITLRKGLVLELDNKDGHKQDIADYLLTELRIGEDERSQQIREEIMTKANGIFIWVVLVVDILNKEYDHGLIYALEQRLADIPSDIYKLFHDILTRHSDGPEKRAELGLCIQWVLFSRRPLTPRQLCAAVSYGILGKALSEDKDTPKMSNGDIKRYILNVSKGLTDLTTSAAPTVQFIHESVKDFFLKKDGFCEVWPEYAQGFQGLSHERLQKYCLAYMNVEQNYSRKRTGQNQSFFDYAVKNVLYHADQAAQNGMSPDQFLREFPLNLWINLSNKLEQYPVRRYTADVSLGYILAEKNLPYLIKASQPPVKYLEENVERFRAPLLASLAYGHLEATRALLEGGVAEQASSSRLPHVCSQLFSEDGWQGAFNLDFAKSKMKTILAYLAAFANKNMLKLLIELRPELLDQIEEEPSIFVLAAANGQVPLLTSLVQRGVDINIKSREDYHLGLTALQAAAACGRAESIHELARYVDVSTELDHQSAIASAVIGGFEEIVEALVSSGIYANHRRKLLYPLQYSSAEDFASIVTILLRGGVDVNAAGPDNQDDRPVGGFGFGFGGKHREPTSTGPAYIERSETALNLACVHGHERVVKLLLDHGADPNGTGISGRTPLLKACASVVSRRSIVEMLLEKGADPNNAQQTPCNMPLLALCEESSPEVAVVKMLIANGASLNASDQHGNELNSDETVLGILAAAIKNCTWNILHLLLEQAAQRPAASVLGGKLLYLACAEWRAEVVQAVLDQDMLNDSFDLEGFAYDADCMGLREIVLAVLCFAAEHDILDQMSKTATVRSHARLLREMEPTGENRALWRSTTDRLRTKKEQLNQIS